MEYDRVYYKYLGHDSTKSSGGTLVASPEGFWYEWIIGKDNDDDNGATSDKYLSEGWIKNPWIEWMKDPQSTYVDPNKTSDSNGKVVVKKANNK